MKCPKCKNQTLTQHTIKKGNVELDRCPNCKGLWFDSGEMKVLLKLKTITAFTIPPYAFEQESCLCPRCNKALSEFCYPGTLTLIDACKACNGVWLDNNEWVEIKEARPTISITINCPSCGKQQEKGNSCIHCGIVYSKFNARQSEESIKPRRLLKEKTVEYERASYADKIPGIKGGLLRFIDRTIDTLTDY